MAVSASDALRDARRSLDLNGYANSTRESRNMRIETLKELGKDVGAHELLPLKVNVAFDMAAALKAGGYRSGTAYLYLAKQLHVKAGHPWNEELELCMQDATRSVRRWLAPSKPGPTRSASRSWPPCQRTPSPHDMEKSTRRSARKFLRAL